MKSNIWINFLEANKLMRDPDEVTAFENALASLADRPQNEDLPDLHLILIDRDFRQMLEASLCWLWFGWRLGDRTRSKSF